MLKRLERKLRSTLKIFFEEPNLSRPLLEGADFKILTLDKVTSLKAPLYVEEVGEVACEGLETKVLDQTTSISLSSKNYWEILEEDVLNIVNEFHSFAIVPKVVTTSFLALIPKVDNPKSFGEYMPIS